MQHKMQSKLLFLKYSFDATKLWQQTVCTGSCTASTATAISVALPSLPLLEITAVVSVGTAQDNRNRKCCHLQA
jgi:hypothetical protein